MVYRLKPPWPRRAFRENDVSLGGVARPSDLRFKPPPPLASWRADTRLTPGPKRCSVKVKTT
eukprot:6959249-Prymnesium_polylepis.1